MPRRSPAPTHYLRGNAREWTPAHAIFLDTETRTTEEGDRELLTLRCWASMAVDRREQRKTQAAVRHGQGETREGIAFWVDLETVGRKATWLFSHNLTFDLTVADLIGQLVDRGWTLGGEWSGHDRAAWFRLAKDGRTLALVDSVTWLPAKLADVAPLVGLCKPADPPADDDIGWQARCRADVAILSKAMLELMAWWDRDKLGNWTVTGNACGWNAMRHMTPTRTILIRVGDGGRELERRAIYGGRRDATRWGDVDGGPFVTLDFEDAYPTLAKHVRIPAKRLDRFDSLPVDHDHIGDGAIQVLAECVVTCDVPRYPVRHVGAVWYPVGTFPTVLAGPELQEAKSRGELLSVHGGYRYWCDAHLAHWAEWVLDVAHRRRADTPPVAALPAKRWGRSVPGRFGQRIGVAERYGPAETVGWSSHDVTWPSEGVGGRFVDLAGERWLVKNDQEADDSFPAALAWFESHTRVRLSRMLDLLGEQVWVSCNTDGALVDVAAALKRRVGAFAAGGGVQSPAGAAAGLCDRLAAHTWPLVPRPKDSYTKAWLAGPATLELDGTRVMSGIAASATPQADGKLGAYVWPGLAWQMASGDRRGFVRPLQSYSVPSVTVHRWALVGGRAAPVVASEDSGLSPFIHPFANGVPGQEAGCLAPEQSRAIARLASSSLKADVVPMVQPG